MARNLRLLPGRKLAIQIQQRVLRTLFEPRDVVADIEAAFVIADPLQLQDLAVEIGDRFFEVEVVVHPSAAGPSFCQPDFR